MLREINKDTNNNYNQSNIYSNKRKSNSMSNLKTINKPLSNSFIELKNLSEFKYSDYNGVFKENDNNNKNNYFFRDKNNNKQKCLSQSYSSTKFSDEKSYNNLNTFNQNNNNNNH